MYFVACASFCDLRIGGLINQTGRATINQLRRKFVASNSRGQGMRRTQMQDTFCSREEQAHTVLRHILSSKREFGLRGACR